MTGRFQGIIPPLVTPFDDNGELDKAALAAEVEYLVAAGVHGIAVGGLTGDGAGLEPAELYAACRTAVQIARRRVPIYGSAVADTTRQAVRFARAAKEAGVAGLRVTPPHGPWWTPDADGLVEYYARIAGAAGLPIVVGNVIPWAPVTVEAAEKVIAAVPLVEGVEQGGDLHRLAALLYRLGDRVTVLSALDDLLYPSFVLRAPGAIAAVATVLPGLVVRLFEAVRVGRHAEALAIHRRLLPVGRAIEGPNWPAKVRYALELQGRRAGRARRPIRPPSGAEKADVEAALAAAEADAGREPAPQAQPPGETKLVFYVDGASSGNPGPAGIGLVAFAGGRRVGAWQEPVGMRTNNEAEYLALKRALELALELGARQVEVRLDSELIYRQVRGEYRVLDRRLQTLYRGVKELASRFDQFELRRVARQENAEANRLAQQAARTAAGKLGQPGGAGQSAGGRRPE